MSVGVASGRHLQSLLGSLGRLVRSPLATLLTLMVIALALALPTALRVFVTNAQAATGNLDPDLSLEVMRLFRRFQDVGVTVVIASHDHHLVREFGQRVIVLENGQIQGDAADPLPSVLAYR